MNVRGTLPGKRVSVVVLSALALCLVLLGGALAGCGGDSSSSADDGAAESPFVGNWEGVDAVFDITWAEDEGRSYSISSGGSGGGLEVTQADQGLTVTLVGTSGTRSDALPATEAGDTLSFDIPISEEMPTPTTLTSTGAGTAKLAFDGSDTTWDFQKTDEITQEK